MRSHIRIFLYIAIPILCAFATVSFMNRAFRRPMDSTDKVNVLIEVSPKMSFRDICAKIRDKEVARYGQSLRILAKLKGIKTDIKPGEYVLSASMTPQTILETLVSGQVYKRPLTVNAGESIWEIGERVEEAGLLTAEEFNIALTDATLLARAGIGAQSFEGYLFPGKYSFGRPITAEKVIWTMLEAGEKNWPPEYSEHSDKIRLSRHEILILGSMLQKEADNAEQMPIISSVFHNRLSQGMKLQSDATIIYGLKIFSGTLTDADREKPSPYNTFMNYGLPVGPVCNPGPEAIRAALFPEKTAHLFFLKDGMGGYIFSTTQREHDDALRKLLLINKK